MAWSIPAAIAAATDRTAAWFNAISGSFAALSQHTHNNSDGDGATLTGFYYCHDSLFIPGMGYDAEGGGVTLQSSGGTVYDSSIFTATAQNSYVEYSPILRKGTYTLHLTYKTQTSHGIITFSFNGVNHETTVDTYGGASTGNEASITGIVFLLSQAQAIRLTAATKNASSSNYTLNIQGLHLLRTGD